MNILHQTEIFTMVLLHQTEKFNWLRTLLTITIESVTAIVLADLVAVRGSQLLDNEE